MYFFFPIYIHKSQKSDVKNIFKTLYKLQSMRTTVFVVLEQYTEVLLHKILKGTEVLRVRPRTVGHGKDPLRGSGKRWKNFSSVTTNYIDAYRLKSSLYHFYKYIHTHVYIPIFHFILLENVTLQKQFNGCILSIIIFELWILSHTV